MNNIFEYLYPQKKDIKVFESIKQKYGLNKEQKILWYHSAGSDYRTLHYFYQQNEIKEKPDLFVFTNYENYALNNIKNTNILFRDNRTTISFENSIKMKFEDKIENYFTPMYSNSVFFRRIKKYPIYLFDIRVDSVLGITFKVPLLYFIWENTAFLKAFVLERNLKIKYFQKPRDNYCGNWYIMFFLLCYLGLMEVKYLLLEKTEHGFYNIENSLKLIESDSIMYKKFMDISNLIPSLKLIQSKLNYEVYRNYYLYEVSYNNNENELINTPLSVENKFFSIRRKIGI